MVSNGGGRERERHGVGLRVIRNVCKNFGREYWRENNLENQALYKWMNNI